MKYANEVLQNTMAFILPKGSYVDVFIKEIKDFRDAYLSLDRVIKRDTDYFWIREEEETNLMCFFDDFENTIEIELQKVIQIDRVNKRYFQKLVEPIPEPASLEEFFTD